jgi:hypothetical protein
MRREVKTPGNTSKSLCVEACTLFEEISKYIKGTMEEPILKKNSRRVR